MQCVNPDITKIITLGANTYLVNDKNYLKDFSAWDVQIRDWLALQERLGLTLEHLQVIDIMRRIFAEQRKHPVVRTVLGEMTSLLGSGKGTKKYFHTLFPGGLHQAFLVAGLPMQDSCC